MLSAIEWLKENNITDNTCYNLIGEDGGYYSTAMERYSNYVNLELNTKILHFRNILKHKSDNSLVEDEQFDNIVQEYNYNFGIKLMKSGE